MMRTITIKLLTPIFILFLYGSSCKKDKYPTYLIDQETKDYCVFTDSTYWIYEEINTQELDTHIVISYLQKIIESRNFGGNFVQITSQYKRSKVGNYIFNSTLNADKGDNKGLIAIIEDVFTPPLLIILLKIILVKDNLNKDSIIDMTGDTIKYLKYLPQYVLSSNNLSFNAIKIFLNSF